MLDLLGISELGTRACFVILDALLWTMRKQPFSIITGKEAEQKQERCYL